MSALIGSLFDRCSSRPFCCWPINTGAIRGRCMRRNYPILGNIRYLVEGISPEIRQYMLESDSDALSHLLLIGHVHADETGVVTQHLGNL